MDKKELYLNSKSIDDNTSKNELLTMIEERTDYGKGFYYKAIDGRKFPTMEDVVRYNEEYWDRMKKSDEGKGIRK